MPTTAGQEELLLLPYTRALEKLSGRTITLTVATPPYPCLGVGTLHVVRATEDQDVMNLVVSYDDFERLP